MSRIMDGNRNVVCHLKKIREMRGISAAALAQSIGVRRQTIHAIESGTFSPNTAIALQLARALDVAALSVLTEMLAAARIEVIAIPCSSRRALEWLKQGRVHAAGAHLLDHASGEYNLPIVRRLFRKGAVRVATFASWEEGLVVRRGNPKAIRSLADLGRKNIAIVNRESGSGSRDLLDKGLRKAGIAARAVSGHGNLASGHLAAAHEIASGAADCCIASRSAARCYGLDFVPLDFERFDLVLAKASLDLPAARAILDLLNRAELRKKLQAVAGYDTKHTGEVLI